MVSQVLIMHFVVARITVDACSALRSNSALFNDDMMTEILTVLNPVLIAARSIIELAATSHGSTRKTQP